MASQWGRAACSWTFSKSGIATSSSEVLVRSDLVFGAMTNVSNRCFLSQLASRPSFLFTDRASSPSITIQTSQPGFTWRCTVPLVWPALHRGRDCRWPRHRTREIFLRRLAFYKVSRESRAELSPHEVASLHPHALFRVRQSESNRN